MAQDAARQVADAGGQVLVLVAVQDPIWSSPRELDDGGWRRLAAHADEIDALVAEHGVTAALNPHVGTLIETFDQIELLLSLTKLGWCLDTGHLLIGDSAPAAFARDHGGRVVYVHLKDVDATVAAQLRAGQSLLQATRRERFRPSGQGDAEIAAVLATLEAHGYDGQLCPSKTPLSPLTSRRWEAPRCSTPSRASPFSTIRLG